jgi:antitoxin ParD1/3/4
MKDANTQQLGVTLPNDMRRRCAPRWLQGEYASESELLREGLRALRDRERALERWLGTEVAAAYDELEADPSLAVPIEDVRARLAAKHKQPKKSATK